jgi:phosphatidylglycerophosphate synthase
MVYLDLTFRRWGTYMVQLFMNTPITPNHITLLCWIAGTIAAAFILIPIKFHYILAAALFLLSHTLDCTDGQLARLKDMKSNLGWWFDGIVDEFLSGLIYATITLAWYFTTGSIWSIVIGLLALFGHHNLVFAHHYEKITLPQQNTKTVGAPADWRRWLVWDTAVFYLLLAVSLIIARPWYFLILMAIKNNVYYAGKVVLTFKRYM